ncbi:glycosyltransferase family 2 protein [Winogradskyella aurantiaca]|uniref:glycosyltransferase family 2 protein n=1 Tax=Winogradskyella aurantiaca TaxID=2219558 RepID=UPI000E1D89CE|nr:glycosyltransferase [Winogradskyella aurantiaca]
MLEKTKVSPLVSIIVTCYNQEKYIGRTLQSVLDQTYSNWECIVVDDGSQDKSREIISKQTSEDQRFKYIYKKNAGVSAARNTGFQIAEGRYINFLDGDDTLLPEKLTKQIGALITNEGFSICVCDHQYYYEKNNKYAYYPFEIIKEKPLRQLLFGWHNGVAFPPHAVLYKRDLWSENEIPFPEDYRYRCEDWVFNVIVALKGSSYLWLDEVLCNYHMSSDNYTANSKNLAKAFIRAAYYLNPRIPEAYQKEFIDETMDNALKMVIANEKVNILRASGNWRLGNRITKPFYWLKSKIKPN